MILEGLRAESQSSCQMSRRVTHSLKLCGGQIKTVDDKRHRFQGQALLRARMRMLPTVNLRKLAVWVAGAQRAKSARLPNVKLLIWRLEHEYFMTLKKKRRATNVTRVLRRLL